MTMMWGGGWWVFGAVVMVVCIFLMGRMMMGHGGSGTGIKADRSTRGHEQRGRDPRRTLRGRDLSRGVRAAEASA